MGCVLGRSSHFFSSKSKILLLLYLHLSFWPSFYLKQKISKRFKLKLFLSRLLGTSMEPMSILRNDRQYSIHVSINFYGHSLEMPLNGSFFCCLTSIYFPSLKLISLLVHSIFYISNFYKILSSLNTHKLASAKSKIIFI